MITIIAEKKEQAKQYLAAFKFLGVSRIKANEYDYSFYDEWVLKDQVSITWTYGHLLQTKRPEEINPAWTFTAIEQLPFFPEKMMLKVDSNPKRKALFNHIKRLVEQSKEVILGGDADREGALIQIQLAEFLGLFASSKKMQRLMITETGPEEVARKIQSLQSLDYTLKLYRGAVARQYLDWVVGMNLSMIYTYQLQSLGYDFGSAFPVGRVKSVALAMVAKRNKAYEKFLPEAFYKAKVTFLSEHHEYKGRLKVTTEEKASGFDGRFFEHYGGLNAAKNYFEKNIGDNGVGKVSAIIEKEHSEQSPLLFSTRSLQNELAFLIPDGAETLELAEGLYNEGYLTYPRTSATVISERMFHRIQVKLPEFQSLLGDETVPTQLHPRERYVNTKALMTSAHEAITVTDKVPELDEVMNWSHKKQTLYLIVLVRCIAMYLPDFVFLERTITTTIGRLDFQSIEKIVVRAGFKALQGVVCPSDEATPQFEPLHINDTVEFYIEYKEGITKPKAKYTLITLLNALATAGQEDRDHSFILAQTDGLGTEATRAEIVKDMISKGVLEVRKKVLELTPKGEVLVAALQYEPLLCQPLLTAKWEEAIQKVEEERLSLPVLIEKNQAFILQAIEKAKHLTKAMLPNIDTSWGVCPKCGGQLYKQKWNLECRSGCDFQIKLEIAHKKLSEQQLQTLISKRRTKLIKGFKGKKGTFNAILVMDEAYKVVFEYLPASEKSKGEKHG